MKTLPDRTLTVMREIARTFFDPGTGVPDDRLEWMQRELKDFFRHVGFITRFAVRMSALALQLAPLFVIGRLARFTKLSAKDRLHFLEKVEGGPLALAFVSVKTFICIVYYEHPAALAETGFDGRALREAASPALKEPAR